MKEKKSRRCVTQLIKLCVVTLILGFTKLTRAACDAQENKFTCGDGNWFIGIQKRHDYEIVQTAIGADDLLAVGLEHGSRTSPAMLWVFEGMVGNSPCYTQKFDSIQISGQTGTIDLVGFEALGVSQTSGDQTIAGVLETSGNDVYVFIFTPDTSPTLRVFQINEAVDTTLNPAISVLSKSMIAHLYTLNDEKFVVNIYDGSRAHESSPLLEQNKYTPHTSVSYNKIRHIDFVKNGGSDVFIVAGRFWDGSQRYLTYQTGNLPGVSGPSTCQGKVPFNDVDFVRVIGQMNGYFSLIPVQESSGLDYFYVYTGQILNGNNKCSKLIATKVQLASQTIILNQVYNTKTDNNLKFSIYQATSGFSFLSLTKPFTFEDIASDGSVTQETKGFQLTTLDTEFDTSTAGVHYSGASETIVSNSNNRLSALSGSNRIFIKSYYFGFLTEPSFGWLQPANNKRYGYPPTGNGSCVYLSSYLNSDQDNVVFSIIYDQSSISNPEDTEYPNTSNNLDLATLTFTYSYFSGTKSMAAPWESEYLMRNPCNYQITTSPAPLTGSVDTNNHYIGTDSSYTVTASTSLVSTPSLCYSSGGVTNGMTSPLVSSFGTLRYYAKSFTLSGSATEYAQFFTYDSDYTALQISQSVTASQLPGGSYTLKYNLILPNVHPLENDSTKETPIDHTHGITVVTTGSPCAKNFPADPGAPIMTYNINSASPTAETITLDNTINNSNCYFTLDIEYKISGQSDGSYVNLADGVTSEPFTYNKFDPQINDTGDSFAWNTPNFPSLVVQTGDQNLGGQTYIIRFTINNYDNVFTNSPSNSVINRGTFVREVDFQVDTGCTKELRGTSPTSFTLNYEYNVGDDPLVIDFTGVDNNDCSFYLELADNSATLDETFFALTQPELSADISDPRIFTVSKYGYLTISGDTLSMEGTHELTVTVFSDTGVADTDFVTFNLSVNVIGCTFTESSSTQVVNYFIGMPSAYVEFTADATDLCFDADMFIVVDTDTNRADYNTDLFAFSVDPDQKMLTFEVIEQVDTYDLVGSYSISLIYQDSKSNKKQVLNCQIKVQGTPPAEEVLNEPIESTNSTNSTQDEIVEDASAQNSTKEEGQTTETQVSNQVVQEEEEDIFDISKFKPAFQANSKDGEEERKIIPLKVSVLSISSYGNLTLYFNKPVQLPKFEIFKPENHTTQQNETNKEIRNLVSFDQLDPMKFKKTQSIKDFIQLQLVSRFYEDTDDAIQILDYAVTRIDAQFIDLKIDFKQPSAINQDLREPDRLKIIFSPNGTDYFIDTQDGTKLDVDVDFNFTMIPQFTLAEFQALESFQKSVAQSATAFSVVQLIINLLLAQGLKYLFNLMNVLQFVVFMQLWQIKLPTENIILLKNIKTLVLFEFLPTKQIKAYVYKFLGIKAGEQEAAADQIEGNEDIEELSGIERTGSQNVIENFGMMLILALLGLVFTVGLCVFVIVFRNNAKVKLCYTTIFGLIFFNAILRFILLGALKFQFSAGSLIAQSKLPGSTVSEITHSASATLLLFFQLVPFILQIILVNNKKNLAKDAIKKRIGTLYLGLKTDNIYVLWFSPLFLMRRSFFVMISFLLFNVPGIQLHVMCFMVVVQMEWLLHIRIYEKKWQSYLELFNELMLILICYHWILLHNLLKDAAVDLVGYSMRLNVYILIFVNTVVIFVVSAHALKDKWKAYKRGKDQKVKKAAKQMMKLSKSSTKSQSKQDYDDGPIFDVEAHWKALRPGYDKTDGKNKIEVEELDVSMSQRDQGISLNNQNSIKVNEQNILVSARSNKSYAHTEIEPLNKKPFKTKNIPLPLDKLDFDGLQEFQNNLLAEIQKTNIAPTSFPGLPDNQISYLGGIRQVDQYNQTRKFVQNSEWNNEFFSKPKYSKFEPNNSLFQENMRGTERSLGNNFLAIQKPIAKWQSDSVNRLASSKSMPKHVRKDVKLDSMSSQFAPDKRQQQPTENIRRRVSPAFSQQHLPSNMREREQQFGNKSSQAASHAHPKMKSEEELILDDIDNQSKQDVQLVANLEMISNNLKERKLKKLQQHETQNEESLNIGYWVNNQRYQQH